MNKGEFCVITIYIYIYTEIHESEIIRYVVPALNFTSIYFRHISKLETSYTTENSYQI